MSTLRFGAPVAAALVALLTMGGGVAPSMEAAPPLFLSHCWVVVTTCAPERSALQQTGFRIAPTVNRHDGQGTASVTVELLNGFLELTMADKASRRT